MKRTSTTTPEQALAAALSGLPPEAAEEAAIDMLRRYTTQPERAANDVVARIHLAGFRIVPKALIEDALTPESSE